MKLAPVWVLVATLVALAGCGKRSHEPQELPAVIAPRDSLIQTISPDLQEWVAMWRAANPAFELDSLSGGSPHRWRPVDVVTSKGSFVRQQERDPDDEPRSTILSLPSPDHMRILDIDSYQMIRIAGDAVEAGGEPDSRSALFDRRTDTEAVLFFSGTMAGAHWGHWLTADRFVLAGWQDVDETAERRQGWLSIYDLRDSTVTDYETPIVSNDVYGRYYAAWKQWLLKRYRETRPRT